MIVQIWLALFPESLHYKPGKLLEETRRRPIRTVHKNSWSYHRLLRHVSQYSSRSGATDHRKITKKYLIECPTSSQLLLKISLQAMLLVVQSQQCHVKVLRFSRTSNIPDDTRLLVSPNDSNSHPKRHRKKSSILDSPFTQILFLIKHKQTRQ